MAETFQYPSCVCPTWSPKPVRLHSSALAFKMAVCPQNFHMHNIQNHGYLITTAKFGFAISICIWFLLAWKHQMGSLRYRLLNKETPVRESIVGLGPVKLVKCPSIQKSLHITPGGSEGCLFLSCLAISICLSYLHMSKPPLNCHTQKPAISVKISILKNYKHINKLWFHLILFNLWNKYTHTCSLWEVGITLTFLNIEQNTWHRWHY